jgi:cold shock CspA family protein
VRRHLAGCAEMTTTKQVGTVKFRKTERGFGFIKPDDDSTDVFLHVSQVPKGIIFDPDQKARVTYEIGPARDGRQHAIRVEVVPTCGT